MQVLLACFGELSPRGDVVPIGFFLAFAGGVAVAVIIALAFQLGFVIRFYNSPRLVLTILTIAAIPAIGFGSRRRGLCRS